MSEPAEIATPSGTVRLMALAQEVTLPGGRTLRYDDVGHPAGRPVVYLHGTPDSRLSRPSDEGLGVRLLAVDRPGYGGTSLTEPEAFGDDLARLMDTAGIAEQIDLVAWSGGALTALWVAGSPALASRLRALTLVSAVVPRDAYDDPAVRDSAAGRLGLLEMADKLSPTELIDGVAPMLAPYPCDRALALEHQREQRSPADQEVLAAPPGALERLADGLVEAVAHGLTGVAADIALQARPLGLVLDRIRPSLPMALWHGTADTVTPPAFAAWYARRFPHAAVTLVDGAGHYLPFTHWPVILGPGAAPGTGPPG
jgi:pimeloyl-ACP methyl ester carboxylesterase